MLFTYIIKNEYYVMLDNIFIFIIISITLLENNSKMLSIIK